MRTMEQILKGDSIDAFYLRGKKDPAFWIERVFGWHIKPCHREWIDLWRRHDRVCIVAPTGFGKTCIFGVGIPLWILYYKPGSEVLVISKIMEHATKLLERNKDMILKNELLRELEPEERLKVTWTKTKIETANGSRLFCRPYTESIKGFHLNYVVADELASYANHDIFFRYVLTRVTAERGKLVGITTPESETDIPHKLLENKQFVTRFYPAMKSRKYEGRKGFDSPIYKRMKYGESIFPELYPPERLAEIRESMGSIKFDREYMVDTLAVEDALFPPNMVLNCWDDKIDFSDNVEGACYIGCDLAYSTGKDADYTVFVVVDNVGAAAVVRRIVRMRGVAIPIQRKELIKLSETFHPKAVLIDESLFGSNFIQDLRMQGLRAVGCRFDYKRRINYLMNLRRIIEERKIIFPHKPGSRAEHLTDELYKELTAMRKVKTQSGITSYQSSAAHDDMVMALALAVSAVPVKVHAKGDLLIGTKRESKPEDKTLNTKAIENKTLNTKAIIL